MSDLKPCPFCGGEAMRFDRQAKCRACNCAGDVWTPVDKWNRRAHNATETAALRQVRDDIGKFDEPTLPATEWATAEQGDLRRWKAALDAILKERE